MSDEEEGESPRKNEGEDADKYPYGVSSHISIFFY